MIGLPVGKSGTFGNKMGVEVTFCFDSMFVEMCPFFSEEIQIISSPFFYWLL